jgi:hypothetical protein
MVARIHLLGVRLSLVALLALSALALGACYGSTEPATGVGEDSATLHARGTANHGPATSYFEYWAAGDPATGYPTPRTPTRTWPAGASGPISEQVSDLLVASQYSFRLCGDDQGATPVCAQTRSLTTTTPAGDYVKGSIALDDAPRVQGFALRFNARSGATGQNPKGTVTTIQKSGARDVLQVSCLKVTGSQAMVVVQPNGTWVRFEVQSGRESVGIEMLTTPLDCSGPDTTSLHPGQGSPVVHDAAG